MFYSTSKGSTFRGPKVNILQNRKSHRIWHTISPKGPNLTAFRVYPQSLQELALMWSGDLPSGPPSPQLGATGGSSQLARGRPKPANR